MAPQTLWKSKGIRWSALLLAANLSASFKKALDSTPSEPCWFARLIATTLYMRIENSAHCITLCASVLYACRTEDISASTVIEKSLCPSNITLASGQSRIWYEVSQEQVTKSFCSSFCGLDIECQKPQQSDTLKSCLEIHSGERFIKTVKCSCKVEWWLYFGLCT